MDFKNYVRMILESNEKAKDKDEDAEDEDELDDEEDLDDDEDDDEEKEATVRTGCTGTEASADTDDEEDSEDDEDSDEDEEDEDEEDEDEKKASVKDRKKCPGCGKNPCVCTKPSLKEAILQSSGYLSGRSEGVMTEEVRVLVEGIKNNSVSRYLSKLAKKAEKEAAKWARKGDRERLSVSKKAASILKEASNKIYKCETRYMAGDVSAKREYKRLCRQYSIQLKDMGRGSKRVFGTLAAILAGAVLLGGVGLTVVANDDIIDKLNYGFQNKEKLPQILGGMAKKNGQALGDLVKALKTGELVKAVRDGETEEAFGDAKERLADTVEKIKSRADEKAFNKEGRAVNWAGQKADWNAQREGYRNSTEQEKYEAAGRKAGEKLRELKDKASGTVRGFKKTISGSFKGFSKGLKG